MARATSPAIVPARANARTVVSPKAKHISQAKAEVKVKKASEVPLGKVLLKASEVKVVEAKVSAGEKGKEEDQQAVAGIAKGHITLAIVHRKVGTVKREVSQIGLRIRRGSTLSPWDLWLPKSPRSETAESMYL